MNDEDRKTLDEANAELGRRMGKIARLEDELARRPDMNAVADILIERALRTEVSREVETALREAATFLLTLRPPAPQENLVPRVSYDITPEHRRNYPELRGIFDEFEELKRKLLRKDRNEQAGAADPLAERLKAATEELEKFKKTKPSCDFCGGLNCVVCIGWFAHQDRLQKAVFAHQDRLQKAVDQASKPEPEQFTLPRGKVGVAAPLYPTDWWFDNRASFEVLEQRIRQVDERLAALEAKK